MSVEQFVKFAHQENTKLGKGGPGSGRRPSYGSPAEAQTAAENAGKVPVGEEFRDSTAREHGAAADWHKQAGDFHSQEAQSASDNGDSGKASAQASAAAAHYKASSLHQTAAGSFRRHPDDYPERGYDAQQASRVAGAASGLAN